MILGANPSPEKPNAWYFMASMQGSPQALLHIVDPINIRSTVMHSFSTE